MTAHWRLVFTHHQRIIDLGFFVAAVRQRTPACLWEYCHATITRLLIMAIIPACSSIHNDGFFRLSISSLPLSASPGLASQFTAPQPHKFFSRLYIFWEKKAWGRGYYGSASPEPGNIACTGNTKSGVPSRKRHVCSASEKRREAKRRGKERPACSLALFFFLFTFSFSSL